MKRLIKKLLRESLEDIAGFKNITPDERKEINRRYNEFVLSDTKSAVEHKKNLKQNLERLEQVKNLDLEQHLKDMLTKQILDNIRVLRTSIDSSKNRDRKAVYDEIAKRYLSMKRYEDDKLKARESKSFGKEDVINLFVDAIEGGSNYWYEIRHLPEDVRYKAKEMGQPVSEAIGEYILNGGYIQFYDAEEEYDDDDYQEKYSDKGLLGTVDMNSILDAITIIKKDYPEVWGNILDEKYDANDADIFLQLCVMGDVVFG
jgi:hypothetical protein